MNLFPEIENISHLGIKKMLYIIESNTTKWDGMQKKKMKNMFDGILITSSNHPLLFLCFF